MTYSRVERYGVQIRVPEFSSLDSTLKMTVCGLAKAVIDPTSQQVLRVGSNVHEVG